MREGNCFVCRAGYGFAEHLVDKAIYKIPEPTDKKIVGITTWVVKHGKPLTFKTKEELHSFPAWQGKYDLWNYPDNRNSCQNLLVFPLKNENRIFGAIKVENRSIEEFSNNHIEKWALANTKILDLDPRYSEINELFVDFSL